MTADVFWQAAMRFMRPAKSVDIHFELMSNDEVDRWLEAHRPA